LIDVVAVYTFFSGWDTNFTAVLENLNILYCVVTVARICKLVDGGVFLTCHHSGGAGSGGKWSVSRLRLVALECANCLLHVTVERALSEIAATVSLSTV